MPMLPLPKPVAAVPITVAPFTGAPMGIARDLPQHELSDTECWMTRDTNLNDPGLMRRRGPLTELASSGKSSARAIGMARCQDPVGLEQMIVLYTIPSSTSAYYGIQNTTSITASAWPYTMGVSPYELFDSKAASTSGVFIGTAPKYDNPANQAIALWRGASKPDATNLAVSAVTRGDATVTLTSAIASCSVGHHVFDHSTGSLVGTIKSISGAVATLQFPAHVAVATSIDVQVLRGVNPRVSVGSITADSSSTTINGGATKFSAQGLATGTWDIYTPNYKWVGTVSSVTSDTQLVLTATAAVSLTNSGYIAIQTSGSYSLTRAAVGWMNASYAGHQFFANGNVLRFSDLGDPETVDTTTDGNSIIFSADPIRAIVPTTNSLVVLTENEAYELTGAVGTTPDRWRGDKISTDGTICGMSAMAYNDGVIWAGGRGIWFFSGATPQNVVAKLDGDYRSFVKGFTSSTMRAYTAVVKDHLLCFVEGGTSGVFQVVTNATTHNVTRPTFVVNLNSGAQTIWENVEIRGCCYPADFLNLATTALLPLTTLESATAHVRVVDGEALFGTGGGSDSWACEGGPAIGPKFYVETKKYDMGDPTRTKIFRLMLLDYYCKTGQLLMDTVPHLNTTGTVLVSPWAVSTVFVTQRLNFNVRSQLLAVRVYEDPADAAADVILGPWCLGFKWSRPGRAN